MPDAQMPTVGRTVHFFTRFKGHQGRRDHLGPYPAVVVGTYGAGAKIDTTQRPAGAYTCDLHVMTQHGTFDILGVNLQGTADAENEGRWWVWPPRV